MTKKITRLFCIVLALALVCTFVAGCSMFQTNADRYREKTAFKVGEQTVTVGALEDFINTNMSNYLNQGYDIQSVWDALMPQFIMKKYVVAADKGDFVGVAYKASRKARGYNRVFAKLVRLF